jgi:hypothetical protein
MTKHLETLNIIVRVKAKLGIDQLLELTNQEAVTTIDSANLSPSRRDISLETSKSYPHFEDNSNSPGSTAKIWTPQK